MEAINAALEAPLHRTFDDASAWSVYADWLLERGEPRGALIHLELSPRPDPQAVRRLIDENWTRWNGDLSPKVVTEVRFGFPRTLFLSGDGPLPARTVRFLRRLEVCSDFVGALDGLEELKSLEELTLDRVATMWAGQRCSRYSPSPRTAAPFGAARADGRRGGCRHGKAPGRAGRRLR